MNLGLVPILRDPEGVSWEAGLCESSHRSCSFFVSTGCAELGQTIQDNPKAVLGSVGGAAAGGLIAAAAGGGAGWIVNENGDGVIDRAEFIDRTVEVFYAADADKDGYLSPEELEHGVLNPQDFTHADRNGDGRISLSEFLWARDALFDEADTNGDGGLQLDEVVNIYEKKVKK